MRGGSTISQQLVKNLFFGPAAPFSARARSSRWCRGGAGAGKQRILEIYLNVVEWGPGIYGAEPRARLRPRRGPEYQPGPGGAAGAILPAPLKRRPERMNSYQRVISGGCARWAGNRAGQVNLSAAAPETIDPGFRSRRRGETQALDRSVGSGLKSAILSASHGGSRMLSPAATPPACPTPAKRSRLRWITLRRSMDCRSKTACGWPAMARNRG